MKIISLITILLLMLNCKPNTKEPKKMDNNTVEYKAFMKQENRIELNGCTLKYNETPIKIGMSLSEVKSVLGNESKVYSNEYYEKNTKKYYWSSKGIEITISNFLVTHIYIYIKNTYLEYPDINLVGNKTILLNQTILNQEDKMHEFVKRANLTFDKMGINSSGYTLEYACEGEKLAYFLDSQVPYHRKGGGHLSVSGDWKLDETNPINSIHLYHKEED